ncbi:hypothetical protein KAU45_07740 [bacterium]|nr:hypothetical protein [bacterium]
MEISWTDVIIAIVALYGAVIATITLIAQIKSKKRKMAVTLDIKMVVSPTIQDYTIELCARNIGNKVIYVSAFELSLPGYHYIDLEPIVPIELPKLIRSGESASYNFRIDKLVSFLQEQQINTIKEICGIVHDQIGKCYTSNKLNFDIKLWKSMYNVDN